MSAQHTLPTLTGKSLGVFRVDVGESDLNGARLYGDNFGPDELADWYAQEEYASLDLRASYYKSADSQGDNVYEYEALNRFHSWKMLAGRRFSCCVALGCSSGGDVAPFAPIVQSFVGIEPAEKWWRSQIGGKPARFIKPTAAGDIPLENSSADLATSFGVLHHVPNVSHVVGEIARVLKPGGIFLVREPISWMGDWRRNRPGLTPNERGLPLSWFECTVRERGFAIVRRRVCVFQAVARLFSKMGLSRPYGRSPVVFIDWVISEALRWNIHYRRDSTFKKIAPGSAFWILQRLPS
jgi:SAM-dependent methyltransferase